MNRINRKIITALIISITVMIITGGAVTYGFQGVLAALGLLFLLASAGAGIYIMRKARLYAKIVKQANWINNMAVTPVSIDDKKWIMDHLDEYFQEEQEAKTPVFTRITQNDSKIIMNHLDEFLAETWADHNSITPEDKEYIMDNIYSLFDSNREEDRQTFA